MRVPFTIIAYQVSYEMFTLLNRLKDNGPIEDIVRRVRGGKSICNVQEYLNFGNINKMCYKLPGDIQIPLLCPGGYRAF